MGAEDGAMKLGEWLDKFGPEKSRWAVCKELSAYLETTGTPITAQTIANVARGYRLQSYDRAKALSDATKGEVTVAELCEE
jgi:hypothetical protein